MNRREELMMDLFVYANDSLRGALSGQDILSGIVNTIDAVCNGELPQQEFASDEDRERAFIEHVLSYKQRK